jgi:phosphate starvation-inducible PhoH-like protein
VCGKIEGIANVQFGEKDVVRHNLVQQIIRAYEDYETVHPQRGGANGKATPPKEAGQETQQG